MNKAQAIHNFWAGFGWPAYDQGSVPDGAPFPRITYQVQTDSLGNALLLNASLWDISTSWERVSLKSDEIARAIVDMAPPSVEIEGGRLYIAKGTPFSQRLTDPDSRIRRILLNINVEFFTAN